MNVEERSCGHCQAPFTPTADALKLGRGLYCSADCAKTASRGKPKAPPGTNRIRPKTRAEWYYAHGWAPFSAALRAETGACGRCGATEQLCAHHRVDPFMLRDVGLLFDLTNIEVICATCHAREHHSQGASSVCARCGVTFGHNPAAIRVYCSRLCDFAARRENARPERPCAICTTPFRPTEERIQCCSPACGMKLSSQKKQASRVAFTCPVCQTPFTMSKSQAARGVAEPCCSRSCATKRRCDAGWNPMTAAAAG